MVELNQAPPEQFRVAAPKAPLAEFPITNHDVRTYLQSLRKPISDPDELSRLLSEKPEDPKRKIDPKFKPLLFKEPESERCVLGLWPGEGNKIVWSGKGCEYHIEKMTAAERLAQQIEREFQQTPEYRKQQEERRAWSRRHTMD